MHVQVGVLQDLAGLVSRHHAQLLRLLTAGQALAPHAAGEGLGGAGAAAAAARHRRRLAEAAAAGAAGLGVDAWAPVLGRLTELRLALQVRALHGFL